MGWLLRPREAADARRRARQRRPRERLRAGGLPGPDDPVVALRQNYVDHRIYDHTSTLRFIEWRFLGAPPEGPGGDSTWNLTLRDRHANNIAASLGATHPDPELGYELDDMLIGPYSQSCPADTQTHDPPLPEGEHPDPFVVADEFREVLERKYPKDRYTPWFDVKEQGA